MNSAPFIAVEGAIGAGKTTLATMLSKELNLPLVKEIVEENPFLASFYQNIDEWSFQLEMFFYATDSSNWKTQVYTILHKILPSYRIIISTKI